MVASARNAPHEVQTDIYVARRKRMHSVFDHEGVPVYHAPHIMQVMKWLAEQEVYRATFTDDEVAFDVQFRPCALPSTPTGD